MPQLPPIPALHHPGSSPSLAPAHLSDKGRPTFGVHLADQMARDDVDVPPILVKCCEHIEKYGLDQQGLYRVGGTHRIVQKLKERLDRGTLCFVMSAYVPSPESENPNASRSTLWMCCPICRR